MKNNKRVQTLARDVRVEVLQSAPPALAVAAGKRTLPGNAEPAEVRENVAVALRDASGGWVFGYALEALWEEERSQRCRLALAREIAAREPLIDNWLRSLIRAKEASDRDLERGAESPRIKDVVVALGDGVRSKRGQLDVSPESGLLLAELVRGAVPRALPNLKHLEPLVISALEFLDEVLAVRLTLMDEPSLYQPIEVISRWWSPRPFPLAIRKVARPIEDKLVAGIIFRARGGQRSEVLLQRLKQLVNDDVTYQTTVETLVLKEPGLAEDLKDWLLGIKRRPAREASTAVLSSISIENYLRQFGELLRASAGASLPPTSSNERHLASLIRSMASELGLRLMNDPGERTEFIPNVYDTVSGIPPRERMVEVVSAPILRERQDGTLDIVLKGLVKDLS
jgi:hypothetical protein